MIPNIAESQPTAQATGSKDMGTKDVFLKILVAQMQNQDPLKPQDAAQMSTQLAQFNMVEQQINTNFLLQSMIAELQMQGEKSNVAFAAPLIGHQVSAYQDSFEFEGGGSQDFVLLAESPATKATVEIVDSTGRVVRTLHEGSLQEGKTPFTWDGKTDTGGDAAPGKYSIKVTATDADGQPVAVNTQISGTVSAIRLTPEGVFVVIGTTPVPVAVVSEVF